MNVVVGTYEELILGYHLNLDEKDGGPFSQHFTDHSHVGSIRAAAISKKGILATGSTDEVIRLFNLKKSKELGTLMQHKGSILDLRFFENYLFSTSEDGLVIVWKTNKWEPQRTLRGHKDAVYSVAIHPTGKMALTVSKDKTMKTWNLMTGKCAYTTNLKMPANVAVWSCDGEKYALVYRTHIDIYSVQSGKVVGIVRPGGALNSAAFIEEQILLVGGDDGTMYLYDVSTTPEPQQIQKIDTKTNRVKCIEVDDGSTCESGKLVATAHSDGHICIWKITKSKETWNCEKLCDHDCKFRPISLAFYKPPILENQKAIVDDDVEIKEEVEEEEEDDEDDSEAEAVKPSKKAVKRPRGENIDKKGKKKLKKSQESQKDKVVTFAPKKTRSSKTSKGKTP